MTDNPQNSKPTFNYLTPQNLEAEESILSSIIIDNSALLDIMEMISPDDFYKSQHQKIYSAILELFKRSEPIDLITLTNYLRDRGKLEEIGGATYIARLLDSIPLAINTQHYAKIIYEKACLRRLIEKSNAITKQCFENQGNVEEVVDFAEKSIFEVAEKRIKPAFVRLGSIIEKNLDALEQRQHNRVLLTGVSSGFTKLDELTAGFQNSDLIILAARPSMGKTSLALNFARNAAFKTNTSVAIFSLEMSMDQLSLRMLSSEAKVDSSRMRRGNFASQEWIQLTTSAGRLSSVPIYIDDSPGISTIELRAKARRLKVDKNLGLILIDYLQLMQSSRNSNERRELEISEISRSLKALAKELNVPVIALSQLNRKVEDRADKRPQLADLRESGALEQDADVVLFIYRDEVYNKDQTNPNKGRAEIIIAKQRNGPVGTVNLAFLNSYTKFEDIISEAGIQLPASLSDQNNNLMANNFEQLDYNTEI